MPSEPIFDDLIKYTSCPLGKYMLVCIYHILGLKEIELYFHYKDMTSDVSLETPEQSKVGDIVVQCFFW